MSIMNVTCQSGTTHAVSLFPNGFQVVNQHIAREFDKLLEINKQHVPRFRDGFRLGDLTTSILEKQK